MRDTRKTLIITNTTALCDCLWRIGFGVFQPRFAQKLLSAQGAVSPYTLADGRSLGKAWAVGGNLSHLGHSGLLWQPEIYNSYWIIWVCWVFFLNTQEWESFNIPLFRNNPIITALFLSLPLLMFLVWAGVPRVYSSLPWVLTLLVEGMVSINVQQQRRSAANTLSSASHASPFLLLLWLKCARSLCLLCQQLALGLGLLNWGAGEGGGCFFLASSIKEAALLVWAALFRGGFKVCFFRSSDRNDNCDSQRVKTRVNVIQRSFVLEDLIKDLSSYRLTLCKLKDLAFSSKRLMM